MKKEKKFYQKWWFWLIIVLAVLFVILGFSGGDYDSIMEDYNKNIDLVNDDVGKLDTLMLQWNTISEGNIDVDDVVRLANIGDNYQREYNVMKNHIGSARDFINFNEEDLKYLEVDTFNEKRKLNDLDSGIQNNINGMISDIESYISDFEAQQQETDELEGILGLLELLI